MNLITYSERFRPFLSCVAAAFALCAALILSLPHAAEAQNVGWIEGAVHSAAGDVVPGAAVRVQDSRALTDEAGRFVLGPLPAGQYELRASIIGYHDAEHPVEVDPGDTVQVRIALEVRPIELTGVSVAVLRPDMQPEAELQEREVRQANPRDVGELLRELPGMSSVPAWPGRARPSRARVT